MEETLKELTEIIRVYCNQRNDFSEHISTLLSIIAIAISIYAVLYEKKINNNNLQADYYKEIFGDYLKNSIPEVSSKLSYDGNGRLERSYRDVTRVLFEMYAHCGYFKYVDNDFYEQLKNEIQAFDDLSINKASESIREIENQTKSLIELHQQIERIVQLINKQYQKI